MINNEKPDQWSDDLRTASWDRLVWQQNKLFCNLFVFVFVFSVRNLITILLLPSTSPTGNTAAGRAAVGRLPLSNYKFDALEKPVMNWMLLWDRFESIADLWPKQTKVKMVDLPELPSEAGVSLEDRLNRAPYWPMCKHLWLRNCDRFCVGSKLRTPQWGAHLLPALERFKSYFNDILVRNVIRVETLHWRSMTSFRSSGKRTSRFPGRILEV